MDATSDTHTFGEDTPIEVLEDIEDNVVEFLRENGIGTLGQLASVDFGLALPQFPSLSKYAIQAQEILGMKTKAEKRNDINNNKNNASSVAHNNISNNNNNNTTSSEEPGEARVESKRMKTEPIAIPGSESRDVVMAQIEEEANSAVSLCEESEVASLVRKYRDQKFLFAHLVKASYLANKKVDIEAPILAMKGVSGEDQAFFFSREIFVLFQLALFESVTPLSPSIAQCVERAVTIHKLLKNKKHLKICQTYGEVAEIMQEVSALRTRFVDPEIENEKKGNDTIEGTGTTTSIEHDVPVALILSPGGYNKHFENMISDCGTCSTTFGEDYNVNADKYIPLDCDQHGNILTIITNVLDARTLLKLGQVCKSWYSVTFHYFAYLFLFGCPLSSPGVSGTLSSRVIRKVAFNVLSSGQTPIYNPKFGVFGSNPLSWKFEVTVAYPSELLDFADDRWYLVLRSETTFNDLPKIELKYLQVLPWQKQVLSDGSCEIVLVGRAGSWEQLQKFLSFAKDSGRVNYNPTPFEVVENNLTKKRIENLLSKCNLYFRKIVK